MNGVLRAPARAPLGFRARARPRAAACAPARAPPRPPARMPSGPLHLHARRRVCAPRRRRYKNLSREALPKAFKPKFNLESVALCVPWWGWGGGGAVGCVLLEGWTVGQRERDRLQETTWDRV